MLAADAGAAVASAEVATGLQSSASNVGIEVARTTSNTIVFLDGAVEDQQSLLNALPTDAEFVLIDSSRDGLDQVSEVLRTRRDVRSIHIVSHGEAGQFQLGNQTVDVDLLHSRDSDVRAWADSMSGDADILLYGCNSAEGSVGDRLLQMMSTFTGADVAGSTDRTGNEVNGGDWVFEKTFGDISTAVVFDVQMRNQFSHTLDIVINAWGQTGEEQFNLQIDGQVVATYDAATTWTPFVYQTNQALTGDRVRVEFTNDAYDPATNRDRNLFVNNIQINGENFESESSSVFSTGTWLPEDGIVPGFGRDDILHANGYFQYGDDQPSGDGSTIVVNAYGDEGTEKFVLQVGSETFEATTVSTSLQQYVFQTESQATLDSIRIEFINDNYDPANGIDTNLTVDSIVLDGQTTQTEAPETYASGVWDSASQRLVSGQVQAQTLNGNGYFQYDHLSDSSGGFTIDDARGDSGIYSGIGDNLKIDAVSSPTGRIAITTSELVTINGRYETLRYVHVSLPNGQGDPNFGVNGELNITPYLNDLFADEGPTRSVAFSDAAFDSQERLVMVGQVYFGTGIGRYDYSFMIRINADGSIDDAFSSNDLNTAFRPTQVNVDSNDRVLVSANNANSLAITRFSESGNLDTSYGNAGTRFIPASQVSGSTKIHEAIQLGNDSTLILLGDPSSLQGFSATLARVDSNGNFDTSFGDGGFVRIPEASYSDNASYTERFEDMTVDNQGRTIVGGDRLLLRYDYSGNLDTSFGDGGQTLLAEDVVEAGARYRIEIDSLATDSQNRIIASNWFSPIVVRVNANGTLDNSISNDGYQVLDTPDTTIGRSRIDSILTTSDNRLVVSGEKTDTSFLAWFIG